MAQVFSQLTAEEWLRGEAIEKMIRERIEGFRGNTEAAIVALSLMRILRDLFDAYDPETRKMLLEGAVAYLQHRDVEEELRQAKTRVVGPEFFKALRGQSGRN